MLTRKKKKVATINDFRVFFMGRLEILDWFVADIFVVSNICFGADAVVRGHNMPNPYTFISFTQPLESGYFRYPILQRRNEVQRS